MWIPSMRARIAAGSWKARVNRAVARTRDARNFARNLDETIVRWGDDAEVH
jgi:alkyl sulfatase BDS1-like metallo-beta-lactamase superfamily hydrolase